MVGNNWECRDDINTYDGWDYSKVALTNVDGDDCTSCNPVYGDVNNNEKALAYCQKKCEDDGWNC